MLLSPMSSSKEWTVCRASSCTYHSKQNVVLSTAVNLSTACTKLFSTHYGSQSLRLGIL